MKKVGICNRFQDRALILIPIFLQSAHAASKGEAFQVWHVSQTIEYSWWFSRAYPTST